MKSRKLGRDDQKWGRSCVMRTSQSGIMGALSTPYAYAGGGARAFGYGVANNQFNSEPRTDMTEVAVDCANSRYGVDEHLDCVMHDTHAETLGN